MLIFGNTFINCGNSAIFGDCLYGGLNDFHVYNNVVMITDPQVNAGSPVGILLTTDGGYPASGAPATCVFNNVTIMNNDVVDLNTFAGYTCIGLNNNANKSASFASCAVTNNLMINCAFGIASERSP